MSSVKLAANPDRLTYYSTTKLSRNVMLPGFATYVILWSLLFAVGGALMGSGLGLSAAYLVTDHLTNTLPLESEVTAYMRYFGLTFFGLFLIRGLTWRIAGWEQLTRETEEQEYSPRETVQSITRPMPRPQHETARSTTYAMRPGTYPKTQQEMAELYHVLVDNDWRFVRDVVAKAKFKGASVFPNITANWGAILAEWERLEYVEGGVVTDSGKHWIEANVPAGELD